MKLKAADTFDFYDLKDSAGQKDAFFDLRRDYKFLIPLARANEVLGFFKKDFFCRRYGKEMVFQYRNIYFDTPDYRFFHLHRQGKFRRLKIRIREYINGDRRRYLEIKKKIKGVKTSKFRRDVERGDLPPLSLYRDFLQDELSAFGLTVSDLRPMLEITYQRLHFIARDLTARATLDFAISARRFEASTSLSLIPDYCILEIKSHTYPQEIARFLRQSYKIIPQGFSKYCIASCLLNPELKRNRWKPILKRYQHL